jgi:hypothetical protein
MTLYNFAERLVPEDLRSVQFGALSPGYIGIGTPFENVIRIFFIQNLTDEILMFSTDGINDKWVLAPGGFLLLDGKSNAGYFRLGDRFYVRHDGAAPTTGAVYLSVWYAQD